MQKFTRSLFAVGAVLGLAACGDDVSVTPPQEPLPAGIASVTVAPASISIAIGESVALTASVATTAGTGTPATTVAWTSATPTIASVNATGVVTGVAAGTTTIRATSTVDAGKVGASAVTVRALTVQSVSVTPSSLRLGAGQTATAVANVTRDNGVAGTVTWASNATGVATVSAAGLITAVAPGNAVITATSTVDASKSGSVAVEVVALPSAVTSLTVAPTAASLAVNDNLTIVATAQVASGATAAVLSYSSSNGAVATVNGSGVVTAVSPGTSIITTKAKSTITVGAATRTDSLLATTTITVGARASISIASITQGNLPVNLAGVNGQIEANLNINSGAERVEKVEVFINDSLAASQIFGVNGAPNAPVQLSINTAQFNALYQPKYLNGAKTLVAKIYPVGSANPTASNTVTFTLTNADVVYFDATVGTTGGAFGLNHTGNSATGANGTWWKSGFTYRAHPVAYSASIDSILYSSTACGSAVAAPTTYTATFSCTGVELAQNIGQGIVVWYPASYTLTAAPTLMMTPALAGYVPGFPQFSTVTTNEDNVGPSLSAVSYNNVNIAGWHGTPVTYSATATDAGVGMTTTSASAATTVDMTTDGGTTFAFTNISAATQLPQTIIPSNYQGAAGPASDLLGNASVAHGALNTVFGVDLVVTDAQYANRATSALATIFPLASNGTIYTAATWAAVEAATTENVAVDAIDVNGSGLDNATALTQTIWRSNPAGQAACLASTTYSMNTILADNYAQTTAPQQLDCGLLATARVGRYSWTSYVSDRAGNTLKPYQGSTSSTTPLDSVYILIDEASPNITGIGFQTSLYTAGQPASFSFSANDDYEIKDGLVTLSYLGATSTWVNPVPTLTYGYGASAFTASSFSASPWDNTYVNVLNGQTLTLSYLLGAVDATPAAGTTAAFVTSGILSNAAANVRDWAGQVGGGISAPILSTQVAPTAAYAWATTSASGATIVGNMSAFTITAKTAGTSVTVQQIGATSISLFACSRIDIFEANAGAAAGSVDAATTTALTFVGTQSFASVNFTDNGVNRFYNYGAIPVSTTGGSGLYTAACIIGGRALFSPIF